MAIEGQIAKIVDESALIINRGSTHGVGAGMRFAVFVEVEDVPDPATGQSLGKWELVKGLLVAAHVQDNMTVCAPAAPETGGKEESIVLSAEMVAVSMPGPAPGKLEVDRSQASGRPAAGPVRVGDRVRSTE